MTKLGEAITSLLIACVLEILALITIFVVPTLNPQFIVLLFVLWLWVFHFFCDIVKLVEYIWNEVVWE